MLKGGPMAPEVFLDLRSDRLNPDGSVVMQRAVCGTRNGRFASGALFQQVPLVRL